ncbi:MAG TPA: hypothetical protein VJV79_00525 [Polyangiaceae bacterium]|nr:hypothetical protein [Polyangiaceae bacterium]
MDLLTAGVQVELDADLELDRQRRAEALKAKLTRMLAQGDGAAAIDQMMSLMLEMERTNDRLAWRVLLANRYRFGRSTEKLSRDELKQLYLVFGGDAAVAETQVELPVPAPAEPECCRARWLMFDRAYRLMGIIVGGRMRARLDVDGHGKSQRAGRGAAGVLALWAAL